MSLNESALALIRADERAGLQALPEPEPGITHAYSLVPISRDLYAAIEPPPTRHHVFVIRTRWRREGWVPESHSVWVKRRGSFARWDPYRQVVDDRPGAFGA